MKLNYDVNALTNVDNGNHEMINTRHFRLKAEYFCHIIGGICFVLCILVFNSKTKDYCHYLLFLKTNHYILITKTFFILWAIVSFHLAFVIFKKYLVIYNNPTSKINSAAQGYVEIQGIQHCLPNKNINAPLSGIDCTWYRYTIQEKKYTFGSRWKQWVEIEKGESKENFMVVDTTGQCIIYPDEADIFPNSEKVWYDGSWALTSKYRYTEQLLIPNEYIYVCGMFSTVVDPRIKKKQEEVFKLIKEWKQNYPKLLEKFDIKVNKDGTIDPSVWERVVKGAEVEIDLRYPENDLNQVKSVNIISGKGLMLDEPFIISALQEKELLKKLQIKSCCYLVWSFVLIFPIFSIDSWYASWSQLICK